MDTPTSSCDASTSSNVIPKPVIPGKISWPEAPSIVQNFSLPPSIMYYMAKNPSSPEVYLKMAQSCKYFFEKLPLLIVRNFNSFQSILCSHDDNEYYDNNQKCCVKTDIIKLSSQIWLTDSLYIKSDIPNYTSMFCQKLYRCKSTYLEFHGETIMFNDFKLLAAEATTVHLHYCSIKYDDGKPVMLETIIETMPKIEELQYTFGGDKSMINASTMKNILKLQNLDNLKVFVLAEVPETCSVDDFSVFFKKFNNTHITIFFNDNISDPYKNQLDAAIDEIIESEVPNHIIDYDGQDDLKLSIMYSRETYDFDSDVDEEM